MRIHGHVFPVAALPFHSAKHRRIHKPTENDRETTRDRFDRLGSPIPDRERPLTIRASLPHLTMIPDDPPFSGRPCMPFLGEGQTRVAPSLEMESSPRPTRSMLWQGRSCLERDFPSERIGNAWSHVPTPAMSSTKQHDSLDAATNPPITTKAFDARLCVGNKPY